MRVYFINSYVIKMLLFPPYINTGKNSRLTTFPQNTIDAVAFSLGFHYCRIIPQQLLKTKLLSMILLSVYAFLDVFGARQNLEKQLTKTMNPLLFARPHRLFWNG